MVGVILGYAVCRVRAMGQPLSECRYPLKRPTNIDESVNDKRSSSIIAEHPAFAQLKFALANASGTRFREMIKSEHPDECRWTARTVECGSPYRRMSQVS